MNEVELKYACTDLERVKKNAQEMGFTDGGKYHQIDTYFIVNEQRDGTNIYFRLREENGTYSLDLHKGVTIIETEEIEVSVQDGDAIITLLKELGYPIVCIVDKQREKLRKGGALITLDTVRHLGTFVEIEMMGSADLEPQLKAIASQLGLEEKDLILGKPYSDMIVAKNA